VRSVVRGSATSAADATPMRRSAKRLNWAQHPVQAEPSRPTSPVHSGLRMLGQVPGAMAPAVSVISSKGRRPNGRSQKPAEQGQTTTIDTITSTWMSEARVWFVGSSGTPVMRCRRAGRRPRPEVAGPVPGRHVEGRTSGHRPREGTELVRRRAGLDAQHLGQDGAPNPGVELEDRRSLKTTWPASCQ